MIEYDLPLEKFVMALFVIIVAAISIGAWELAKWLFSFIEITIGVA